MTQTNCDAHQVQRDTNTDLTQHWSVSHCFARLRHRENTSNSNWMRKQNAMRVRAQTSLHSISIVSRGNGIDACAATDCNGLRLVWLLLKLNICNCKQCRIRFNTIHLILALFQEPNGCATNFLTEASHVLRDIISRHIPQASLPRHQLICLTVTSS